MSDTPDAFNSSVSPCNDYNFSKCNFVKMANNCNPYFLNQTEINSDILSNYDIGYILSVFEFLTQIILSPLFCILGVICGILSIVTLRNKNKSKELSENVFIYSQIYFTFNIIYCFIALLKLINKCIKINGIYCPYYIRNENIKYMDIYLFKYWASSIKLCSSITELSIAISRLKSSLISHNKLLKLGSNASFRTYILINIIFSLALSSIKRLEFSINNSYYTGTAKNLFLPNPSTKEDVNSFSMMSFPDDDSNINYWKNYFNLNSYFYILESCNILKYFLYAYNFLSGPCILLSIFIIDLYLFRQVKETNKKKLTLLYAETQAKTKKQNEMKSKEDKIARLIVTNTLILCLIRFPESIATIFHIKINTRFNELSFYYDTVKIIELFDFLFVLNPVFQFILFYKYNRVFKESFTEKMCKAPKKESSNNNAKKVWMSSVC